MDHLKLTKKQSSQHTKNGAANDSESADFYMLSIDPTPAKEMPGAQGTGLLDTNQKTGGKSQWPESTRLSQKKHGMVVAAAAAASNFNTQNGNSALMLRNSNLSSTANESALAKAI